MLNPVAISSSNSIEPLVLASKLAALFYRGSSQTAVLICGGWGYEDLLTRTALNILARRLSSRGFSVLRFDYPANGDSSDQPNVTFDDWISASRNALQELRNQGFEQLIILGHGFGTIIARQLASSETDISGLVLMAPTTPRRFLREMKHFSAMLNHGSPLGNNLNVAGFRFPSAVQDSLSKLKEPSAARNIWTLTVDPALGSESSDSNDKGKLHIPYPNFDVLMTDPILQKIPVDAFDHVIDLLDKNFRSDVSIASHRHRVEPATLKTDSYRETAFFFGAKSLFGVLCEPAHRKSDQIVLFLNMGKNPHTGWGRATVHYARNLAASGIASLRFDISGIGDSLDDPDASQAILFSEHLVPDVLDACDSVASRGFQKISVMGVCSGAYLGLLAAVKDKRIERLFAINLPRFAWNASESIRDVVRFSNRPSDHSVKRLMKPETIRAILNGTLDPRPAMKFKAKSLLRRYSIRLSPVLGRLSPEWNIYSTSRSRMDTLAERRVSVLLAYSQGDDSGGEMELLFGPDGKNMPGRLNVDIHRLDGVDHNFSQAHAIEWLTARMIAMMATEPAGDEKIENPVNTMAGQLMFG